MEQADFLSEIEAGVESWNKMIKDKYSEQHRLEIKLGDNSSQRLVPILDSTNGFENFDFSYIDLKFDGVDFRNPGKSIENLFYKPLGLGSLSIVNCQKIPRIELRNITIKAINISSSAYQRVPYRREQSISDILITHCKFTGYGLSVNNTDINNRLYIVSCDMTTTDNDMTPTFDFSNNSFVAIYLSEIVFQNPVGFQKCSFDGKVRFDNINFKNDIEFIGCSFNDSTDFHTSKFGIPPRFNESSLSQQTLFPPEDNFVVLKTKDERLLATHILALQQLKVKASDLQDRRTQGLFYSLEQKYLRQSSRMSMFESFISYAYQGSSDFGRSVGRPVFLSLILISIYTMIYSGINSEKISIDLPFSSTIIQQSFYESLVATLLPFRLLTQPESSYLVKIISVSESFIAISLLALILLALRWNFRRD